LVFEATSVFVHIAEGTKAFQQRFVDLLELSATNFCITSQLKSNSLIDNRLKPSDFP